MIYKHALGMYTYATVENDRLSANNTMTKQEEKTAFRKRLEEARNKKVPEPVKKAPEPVQQNDGILPDSFLRMCITCFETRPEEEPIHFVDQWDFAALKYAHWLENEGFTRGKSVEILNAALVKANLNLGRFPVCR